MRTLFTLREDLTRTYTFNRNLTNIGLLRKVFGRRYLENGVKRGLDLDKCILEIVPNIHDENMDILLKIVDWDAVDKLVPVYLVHVE